MGGPLPTRPPGRPVRAPATIPTSRGVTNAQRGRSLWGIGNAARAHLVETLPSGLGFDDPAPGPAPHGPAAPAASAESTAEALIRLVEASRATIDLTALYWSLRPSADEEDTAAWTVAELIERFGAGHGAALFAALDAAAARRVRIRILQSPGFDRPAPGGGAPPPPSDSAVLRATHPDVVEVRTVDLEAWYGGGIMHQKLWVFDGRSVYVGSSNTDWRSLSQVKELGVVVEDAPEVAADATRYFDAWWRFAAAPVETTVVFDPVSRIERRVPAWSPAVAGTDGDGRGDDHGDGDGCRPAGPLDDPDLRALSSWDAPLRVRLGGEPGDVVLSGAPRELCVGGRTADEDLLTATILDARRQVCVNVMDFAPISLRRPPRARPPEREATDDAAGAEGRVHGAAGPAAETADHGQTGADRADDGPGPVWWPALTDALLRAAVTNRAHVRLLVSEWAHTSAVVAPLLVALAATARAALGPRAADRFEVRRFRVPGWRSTWRRPDDDAPEPGPRPAHPGHTRVNHVKYVVTDRRINVGTSNMTWDYFNGTAGTSLNATHPALVRRLQALFDRDWASDWSLPLQP
ncbi:MAG TPA: phospholipase D-like domain-containing protein [Acidimicrobiales bacterium]